MNPELSRRGAWVLAYAQLNVARQKEFISAVENAPSFEQLPEWVRQVIKDVENKFGTNPATTKNEKRQVLSTETTKALRQNPTWQQNDGVPSALEIARALSRLEILPNPPIPNIDNPEKYVESPWQVVATPTVDPNLWDDAELELVDFNNLYATDQFLSRKKIRKHVEVLGQAVTQFRSHALVAVMGDRYTIIDGHHRLMSQWLLGQQKTPVWVIRLKEENAATTR